MFSMHEEMLNRITGLIKKDDRFIGLLGAGSLLTGEMDEFSDLDLILVYQNRYQEEVMKNRKEIARTFGSLLTSFTGEHVGEPRLLICLYEDPLIHVDLKFVNFQEVKDGIEKPEIIWERGNEIQTLIAKTNYTFPYPDQQWIEDRIWGWIHYCSLKLGRGEYYEIIESLSFLRTGVLGPLILMKNNQLPRGVRRIEEYAGSYLDKLNKTVAQPEAESCFNALNHAVELYLQLVDEEKIVRRYKAQQAACDYLNTIYKKTIKGEIL
ncbi:oxalate:formate antiporter [Jeotgalibacillus sp. R-1-5s-1]|uniref:oxalate:formate antiporter n=1 Tax=Jeotgalibacillus sp. R-1-5s-1 TaxID=2555897 RepID=UPI001069E5B3|nr:oxalate:formate antiporter [Jeotgalibacillus sp. R-1-5s-1]TFD99904.1 oxalate:formate antiporter [Jeotgalibacillus sp. R-1-5s-1]